MKKIGIDKMDERISQALIPLNESSEHLGAIYAVIDEENCITATAGNFSSGTMALSGLRCLQKAMQQIEEDAEWRPVLDKLYADFPGLESVLKSIDEKMGK